LTTDVANLREALSWSTRHDHELEIMLATQFGWLADFQGLQSEGRAHLRSALDRPGGSSRARYGAFRVASYLAWRQGELQEALRLVRAQVAEARRGGDTLMLCEALSELGHHLVECGFRREAASPLEEAQTIAARLGNVRKQAEAEMFQCLCAVHDDDLPAASRHIERCLELGGTIDRGADLTALAWVRLGEGKLDLARSAIVDALHHRLRVGDHVVITTSLDVAAELKSRTGDALAAIQLAGSADAIRSRTATTASLIATRSRKRWFTETIERMGTAGQEALVEGRRLPAPQAVELALTSFIDSQRWQPPAPAPALTDREREVVALMSGGLTNRQIARRLLVSARTVDAHLEHVRNKLGVANRVDIVRWHLDAPEAEPPARASRLPIAPGSQ
jgi:DNA-binding CsgD family transcriptional regulator